MKRHLKICNCRCISDLICTTAFFLFGIASFCAQSQPSATHFCIPDDVLERSVGHQIDSSWTILIKTDGGLRLKSLFSFLQDSTQEYAAQALDTLHLHQDDFLCSHKYVNSIKLRTEHTWRQPHMSQCASSIELKRQTFLITTPIIVTNDNHAYLLIENMSSGEGWVYQLVRNDGWSLQERWLYYIY